MIQPRILKGFRDFLPAEAIARQYVIGIIRETFESFGFDPIETPALEYLETFTGNIGADEKLFYQFEDHGGRKVALRYDQTVPTCRFVAQYQEQLGMPFKRYQIQSVWRADKPQSGRYREFLQCDIDIFGVQSAFADAETIAATVAVYQNLGFPKFTVKISDRALYEGIDYSTIVAVDKLGKIGREGVIAEIVDKGKTTAEAEAVLTKLDNLQPSETLKEVFSYLEAAGVDPQFYSFDKYLARSFSYSTGPIWEIVVDGYDAGSVGGGERYDKLVGRFTKNDVPGTGIAVGFDRTVDALRQLELLPEINTLVDALVTIFSPETAKASLSLAAVLRSEGLNIDVYPDPTAKLKKQLTYADRRSIPFALISGPDETKNNVVQIKNMQTGEQTMVEQTQVAAWLLHNTNAACDGDCGCGC